MYHSHNLTSLNYAVKASKPNRSVFKTWCAALCLFALPCVAAAQSAGLYEYIKGDRSVVRTQVQMGITYGELALKALLEGGGDEEALKQALALAEKSYVLWRYAWHGVELLYNYNSENDERTKVPDGRLGISLKLIMHARLRNIEARKFIQNAIPWPETRPQNVEQAIQILNKDSLAVARKVLIFLR